MKKIISGVVLGAIFMTATAFILHKNPTNNPKPAPAAADYSKIDWMKFEEAVEASKTNKKKIFIDVYTNWCGWCKRMDATTFADPEVIQYMMDNYYPVKLNAEMTKEVEFQGKIYKLNPNYGRNGTHELALNLLSGAMSYPSFVVLNEDFTMGEVYPGYKKTNQLTKILEKHIEDSKDKFGSTKEQKAN